jgi:hypothetical protein
MAHVGPVDYANFKDSSVIHRTIADGRSAAWPRWIPLASA